MESLQSQAQGGRFETASTALGAKLMEWLRRTSIPIPEVRKGALRESLRSAPDEHAITDILLEAIRVSPFIDNENRERLVSLFLDGRWSDLSDAVLPSRAGRTGDTTEAHVRPEPCDEYKAMATKIFCKSRKVARLSRERRMQLGGAILACASREQLIELLLHSLEAAVTLDDQARCLIANDVFDERYYRLLLPDRFDCSEAPVRGEAPQNTDDIPRELECPICFELCAESDVELPCSHQFCRQCVRALSTTSLDRSFPCPICRRMTHVDVDGHEGAVDPVENETETANRWFFRRLRSVRRNRAV